MIDKRELEEAIEQCKKEPFNYQKCEKLANFIIIYEYFYGTPQTPTKKETVAETTIDYYCDTEFSEFVDGKPAYEVWKIMDELMQMTKILHPKVYDSVLQKIEDL